MPISHFACSSPKLVGRQSCPMAPSRGGQRFVVGLPLIMLTVGGWLGIAHVLSGKFELKVGLSSRVTRG